jgi:LysR family transcriptional regulator, regulator of abg operon
LMDSPWMVTGPLAGPGAVHAQAFINAGLHPPRCVMHCESVGGAIQIIEHSDLVSFVPRHLAEEAESAGLVSIVPVKETVPRLDICAFLPSHKILTPAGQALYSAVFSVSRSMESFSAQGR